MQTGTMIGEYVFMRRKTEASMFPNVVSNKDDMRKVYTVSDEYLRLFTKQTRISLGEYLQRCRYMTYEYCK